MNTEQPHKILGIRPGASLDEIRQAYRNLVKLWHPDSFIDDREMQRIAEEELKKINWSYNQLTRLSNARHRDKEKREFDQEEQKVFNGRPDDSSGNPTGSPRRTPMPDSRFQFYRNSNLQRDLSFKAGVKDTAMQNPRQRLHAEIILLAGLAAILACFLWPYCTHLFSLLSVGH